MTTHCLVCLSEIFHTERINFGCGNTYCKECTFSWVCNSIEKQIQSQYFTIKCLNEACSHLIELDELKKEFNSTQITKINALLLKKYLLTSSDIISCLNCSSYSFTTDLNCKEPFLCQLCNKIFKLPNTNYHEARSWIWMKLFTDYCPRCKLKYSKNAGCNHITCSICSFEFCYKCDKAWGFHSKTNCKKIQAASLFSILMIICLIFVTIYYYLAQEDVRNNLFSLIFEYNGSKGLAYWGKGWLYSQAFCFFFLLALVRYDIATNNLCEIRMVVATSASIGLLTFLLMHFKLMMAVIIATNLLALKLNDSLVHNQHQFEIMEAKSLLYVLITHFVLKISEAFLGYCEFYDIVSWKFFWIMVLFAWLPLLYSNMISYLRGLNMREYRYGIPIVFCVAFSVVLEFYFDWTLVLFGSLILMITGYVTESIFDKINGVGGEIQRLVET